MTMRTLLTAAAIISSAGFGVGNTPASQQSYNSSVVALPAATDIQLGDELAAVDGQAEQLPPAPWAKDDPADSLYKMAREAMSRGDYKRAAEIFHRIPERFPQSAYAGQAMYYEAYSLYRSGGDDDLNTARARLNQLKQKYPDLAKNDGAVLLTRVCGELAKRGDESCARSITEKAQGDADVANGQSLTAQSGRSCPDADDDNDERIMALQALLNMDADRAVPILKQVLAKRDACSAGLRRKAVFLLSQKNTTETASLLMNVARSDPDQEVREQAVFWLSQVPGSTPLLESILQGNADGNIKEKALFALSQQSEPKAQQILRDFALRESESDELRDKAIFWLGQRGGENTTFLRDLFGKIKNSDLREKILFSLSQQSGNQQWLMNVAVDPKEDMELRKKALFWAGQSGVAISDMASLYDRINEPELKDAIIFGLSQRQSDKGAIDKLFAIAKNDKDPEMRKKAIFWLGQSRDPRVQQFLLDLINR
ncbi:MAG TPA: HEAT repeat domain-containing protein [Gemmatimonadaceae bacterium]|nr:HEAT repeat domain-containing protein [Gemmatimonadaceae bacterium]